MFKSQRESNSGCDKRHLDRYFFLNFGAVDLKKRQIRDRSYSLFNVSFLNIFVNEMLFNVPRKPLLYCSPI